MQVLKASAAPRLSCRCQRQRPVSACSTSSALPAGPPVAAQPLLRRGVLALLGAASLSAGARPADAAVVQEGAAYTLDIPEGWVKAEGTATGAIETRRVVIYHAPNDLETNINVIETRTNADITKMGALGRPYEFGFRLVVSQDRRAKKENPQVAELIDTDSNGDGAYLVEYTIARPDENVARHLYSLVNMRVRCDAPAGNESFVPHAPIQFLPIRPPYSYSIADARTRSTMARTTSCIL